jgi:hypothetical protein
MQLWKALILGFVAGFFAVLIFHQGLWYLLSQVGMIPPERPAWPMDPVAPLGVPSVISKSFWGGLWGAGLAPFLGRLSGARYWTAWITIGAVALTLTALYVVSPLKASRSRHCGRVSAMPFSSTAPGASAPRCSCE